MKIGIDARFVGPQGTGLGKYTEKLILGLQAVDNSNTYTIFLKNENWEYLNLKKKNFLKIKADIPWYSLEEQVKMPLIFQKEKLDLLHVPHFNVPIMYRNKFVVTVHDLIHHHFKETSATTKNSIVFGAKRFGYKYIFSNAIANSKKILVPSKYVKRELLKFYKVPEEKIAVTYEAAEEEYFSNRQPTTDNRQPNLLYVGNVYPHKNINKLLDAVKILTTNYQLPTTNLTIVCPRDVFSQRLKKEIEKRGLQNHVKIHGFMKTDQLKKLFQKSSLYTFPTLAEGFGIPGLNAMACGLPVAASDIPILREIYGDAAIYFDPTNAKDIADKIIRALSSSGTRRNLVEKGKKQVEKYSWENMAKETLKAYEQA